MRKFANFGGLALLDDDEGVADRDGRARFGEDLRHAAGLASSFFESMRHTAPDLAFAADDLEETEVLPSPAASVDFCRDVLARVPEKLLVVRDAESGWTDLGSPSRVSEVLTSRGVAPIWPKPLRVAELPPR